MKTFSKKELLGTAAIMIALSPVVVHHAHAASVVVNASAEINQAITLSKQSDLNFGVLTETSPGTVTLDFTGDVTNGPGGLNPSGGATTAGRISVSGESGTIIAVSPQTATFKLLNGAGGSADTEMTVKEISFRLGGSSGVTNLSALLAGTSDDLDIGAKLVSSGSQTSGEYSGSFNVNVVYP